VEAMMVKWLARYQEGFVTSEGASVQLTNAVYDDHPWGSPADALRHWSSRDDLLGADVEVYGNGIQQTDDVSQRPEFRALRVSKIWRRVTFEPMRRPNPGEQ
jgi:hypothetical protein